MSPKAKKIVLLGVSGSVAIYKSCEIASQLTQKGCLVRVVMTRRAAQLISPQLFQALTGERALVDEFSPDAPSAMSHIELAKCDLFLVAPASADLIGRLAHGLADDLVTTAALALDPSTPKLLAPAMNANMWANPLVQENLGKLKQVGYRTIEPGEGYLACGVVGAGRLADPSSIVESTLNALSLRP